jgi:L-fuculose-phosphate aldolase
MRNIAERRKVLEVARRLNEGDLNQGTSGNVSARIEGGFAITPTGMPYDEISIEDICELRLDGSSQGWSRTPSSEWRIHADLYRARAEINGIVHAHPLYGTALSMIALAGGPTVRCSGYATFGTPELSERVQEALAGRKAALLANHGAIAIGGSLDEAFKIAKEMEALAAQYWHALQVGTPVVLDDTEVARVIERFRTYGKQGG